MDGGQVYHVGFWITWVIVFLIVWIACSTQGMIGFCLGWMPAAIIATVAGFLWPLVVLGIFFVVLKLWN